MSGTQFFILWGLTEIFHDLELLETQGTEKKYKGHKIN